MLELTEEGRIRPFSRDQMRKARETLGLDLRDWAAVLETDYRTARAMESAETTSKHRKPAVRMTQLIAAYLEGYRPPHWPQPEPEPEPEPEATSAPEEEGMETPGSG